MVNLAKRRYWLFLMLTFVILLFQLCTETINFTVNHRYSLDWFSSTQYEKGHLLRLRRIQRTIIHRDRTTNKVEDDNTQIHIQTHTTSKALYRYGWRNKVCTKVHSYFNERDQLYKSSIKDSFFLRFTESVKKDIIDCKVHVTSEYFRTCAICLRIWRMK